MPQESHLYSLIPCHPLAFKAPVHTLVATHVQILFTCLLLKCRLRSFHTIWLTALLTQLALDVFSMYILFLFLIIAIDIFTRYCYDCQLYCVYIYIYIYRWLILTAWPQACHYVISYFIPNSSCVLIQHSHIIVTMYSLPSHCLSERGRARGEKERVRGNASI